MARRVRRLFRGGRIVDLAGGHGLLAQVLLILDNSSPQALIVDTTLPRSSTRLHEVLVEAWPRLAGRVAFEQRSLESVALSDADLVVSAHACGALADLVLERASAVRARVAVLPCCHNLAVNDAGSLSGWMDGALAVDVMRAVSLEQQSYCVRTLTIPEAITPKNRLLRSEEHTSELQSQSNLVCRLLLEKKKLPAPAPATRVYARPTAPIGSSPAAASEPLASTRVAPATPTRCPPPASAASSNGATGAAA